MTTAADRIHPNPAVGVQQGYNVFRVSADGAGVHGYVRRARFATFIGESLVDGRPSLMMRYAAFDNNSARTDLVDEVRRCSRGLYLGTATTARPDGTRTQPDGCFLLAGPVNPWTGVDDPTLEQR